MNKNVTFELLFKNAESFCFNILIKIDIREFLVAGNVLVFLNCGDEFCNQFIILAAENIVGLNREEYFGLFEEFITYSKIEKGEFVLKVLFPDKASRSLRFTNREMYST